MEVVVRAGTLLNDFVRELERNGLALETLPTLGDQTIGGALAVGESTIGGGGGPCNYWLTRV